MVFGKVVAKGFLLFLLFFAFLATPANAKAPKEIDAKLNNLSTSIMKNDFNKAYKQIKDFRAYYDKNMWKYQLLGDEQEFEGISNDIESLKAAIIAKDRAQALIFVYDIKEVFDQIYQM